MGCIEKETNDFYRKEEVSGGRQDYNVEIVFFDMYGDIFFYDVISING